MQTASFSIRGTTPLIMHNSRLANPLDPIVKKIKEITGLRKKSDENYEDLFRLEWEAGLYYDEQTGPFIPGLNMDACIKEGAKLQKRGKDVQRGLQTVNDKIRIEYKGPRTLEKMYPQFRDVRLVGVQSSKTLRCRPIFQEWWAKFDVAFNQEVLNLKDVENFIVDGGRFCSIGDGRPRYGKFEIVGD